MKGLDTNVLLRLLLADDAGQARRARQCLDAQAAHGPPFVNRIVLCELVWTLKRGFNYDREQIAMTIDRILESRALIVEDHHGACFALYLYRISRADFADCWIGASNGMLGCERTLTFDRRAGELDEFELI